MLAATRECPATSGLATFSGVTAERRDVGELERIAESAIQEDFLIRRLGLRKLPVTILIFSDLL